MKRYIALLFLLLGCEGKTPFPLGGKFYLDYDTNDYYAIHTIDPKHKGPYGIVVDGDILKINRDSNFIIAFTMPIEKIEKIEDPKQVLGYYEIREKIAKNPMREYWIVDKKITPKRLQDGGGNYYYSTYSVFGPFNEEEYLKKRKELGVSDSLQLLPVMQFLGEE